MRLKRLLITGAAGGLGRALRPRLAPLAQTLRLADIVPITDAEPGQECVTCDLGDAQAVRAMVAGCDGIVHLGGISVEAPFAQILNANLLGLYNLYEAARAEGRPRILFASSNHTIGFYRQNDSIDARAPMKPDSLYGVSKCFGEALASFYHLKFGQETAILRIGSCFAEPVNHRMLSTWLSYDDCADLVACIFRVPVLGCPVIWGVSNNDARWWDNDGLGYLGWRPRDNSEGFRAALDAAGPPPAPDHPNALYQGGLFTAEPIHPDR